MELPVENQRLKKVINYVADGNISQFSKDIGISQPRISRLFLIDSRNGKYPLISFDIIQSTINKFMGINSEWLLTGKGEMEKKSTSAVKSNNSNGIPMLPFEAFAGIGYDVEGVNFDVIKERYEIPLFNGIKIDFMLPVRGSSMYPKYSSGDVVACRLITDKLFYQWNKVYVLDTISQGVIMKRLKKSDNTDMIICKSDNEKYEPFEVPVSDIRNIALVVGVVRLE